MFFIETSEHHTGDSKRSKWFGGLSSRGPSCRQWKTRDRTGEDSPLFRPRDTPWLMSRHGLKGLLRPTFITRTRRPGRYVSTESWSWERDGSGHTEDTPLSQSRLTSFSRVTPVFYFKWTGRVCGLFVWFLFYICLFVIYLRFVVHFVNVDDEVFGCSRFTPYTSTR